MHRVPLHLNSWSRRAFLSASTVGFAGLISSSRASTASGVMAVQTAPEFLTREADFRNVGRGKPPPHELSVEQRKAAGLSRETWELEVIPDPQSNSETRRPLRKEDGTALNWVGLMRLAEKKAVRFICAMTCTNMPGPLGVGLWEGVPLRDVLWLAEPRANVRRVYYYGFHNHDPAQRFQSSLTLERALEDPPGELPVILCYKLNGEWLTPKRGGPVRMVVPGMYGNKSVKWLQRILLTNSPQLNDTYAEWNNDTESALKTCASFLSVPEQVKAGETTQIYGIAQVGMSGLAKVQVWMHPQRKILAADDPYLSRGDWRDAEILTPPIGWGGGLPRGKLPETPLQFGPGGQPLEWPIKYAVAYWRARLPELPPGKYDLRCRTIDSRSQAQPLPRPLLKSGNNAIQKRSLSVV